MRDHRLHAQHVAREGSRSIVHRGLADDRGDSGAVEQVHARPPGEALPARALEEREHRGMVQMPEGVALEGIDGEVDGGQRGHDEGSQVRRTGNAKVCQNTMRRNPRGTSAGNAANAFAPYVGSSRKPCAAACARAASPAAVG